MNASSEYLRKDLQNRSSPVAEPNMTNLDHLVKAHTYVGDNMVLSVSDPDRTVA